MGLRAATKDSLLVGSEIKIWSSLLSVSAKRTKENRRQTYGDTTTRFSRILEWNVSYMTRHVVLLLIVLQLKVRASRTDIGKLSVQVYNFKFLSVNLSLRSYNRLLIEDIKKFNGKVIKNDPVGIKYTAFKSDKNGDLSIQKWQKVT